MNHWIGRATCRDAFWGLGLLLAASSLILWPEQSMSAMQDGLHLCGNVILPSLFPFFVLSSLVVELGLSRYLGRLLQPVMAPLFRVNGNCATALALGFIGGYPVGARTAIQLYESHQCSKAEAERLLAFCNNCGPAFILGVVGTGIFGTGTAGLLLYGVHLTASILIGILFRFYRSEQLPRPRYTSVSFQTASFSKAFTHSITGAMQSILNICAFILFFTVFLRILSYAGILGGLARLLSMLLHPFGIDQPGAERLLTGFLELSSGVSSLSGGSTTGRLSMAAFMLGWAGLSVHCQVLSFLNDSGLSYRTYLTGKFLHGLLSSFLAPLAYRILPACQSASLCLTGQAGSVVYLDFYQVLTISTVFAWGSWLCFLLLSCARTK